MICKTRLYILSFFHIWNSYNVAQAAIDTKNTLASDEFLTCDYSRFESQLEALRTGNEFFKLRFEMIQLQLDKQNDILQRFEQKFDKMPQMLDSLASNIRGQIKETVDETYNLINKQNQMMPVDDKWHMLSDIKEVVKTHDVLFESFSEKLKNVENILKKASWETSTRQLADSISNKLTLLQNIDKKLTNVDTITMDQNRNIQKYLNQTEATKICLETDDQTLVCTTQSYPSSCADFNANHCSNNKCRIHNQLYGPKPFWVLCDGHTEGGGWTVIQRRVNGSINFNRGWSEYKHGFGSIDGEFFIGLAKLHALTTTLQPMELFIKLRGFNDTSTYAKYDEFVIDNETETEKYILSKVGKYSGNATDAFSQHQGFKFTTRSCQGAPWYTRQFVWILNESEKSICWNQIGGRDYALKYVQMMIRPKQNI